MERMESVTIDVAWLCVRLGWRGTSGYERLMQTPQQMIDDWLVINALALEKARHGSDR